MALVHRGGGFNVFCSTIYNFMSGAKTIDLIPVIEEVPDPATRENLQQVIAIMYIVLLWLLLLLVCDYCTKGE